MYKFPKPLVNVVVLFLFFVPLHLFSQNFSGKITDNRQQPLYGSNVYIKEVNQGLTCDDKGEFRTTLANGKYNVVFRCLGYKPVLRTVEVKNNTVHLPIAMNEDVYELKEVTVTNTEDPAYAIIRKAIEAAPQHLSAAKEYTADAYIKATLELLTMSKLVDKLVSQEGVKFSEFTNKVFLQESFNELRFVTPKQYTQTVKGFSSTIPDNFDPKESFQIMNASVYAPQINDNISPLNKDAFKYYKYRYEGFNEENGLTINKIKFEAKYKSSQLIDGYLYIADDTWHVQYAELSHDMYGMKQHFVISYEEVLPHVYLPMSYSLDGKFSVLGTSGEMNYFSSLKYTHIVANDEVITETTKTKPTKRSFEIKTDSLYTTLTDSLATKRSADFWDRVRTVALDSAEVTSYAKKDSIQQYIDSLRGQYHAAGFKPIHLVMGGRIGSDTARLNVEYGGLIRVFREYNFVDGTWLGQKLKMNLKLDKNRTLTFSPYTYYVTGRNRLLYGGDLQLRYAPLKLGYLNVSAASTSEDFNPNGISRLDNTFSSMLFRKSDNAFYQKDFVAIANTIDIANGLRLKTSIEVAKRWGLSNTSEWGIWGDRNRIAPNLYPDDRFDATSYTVQLAYSPYAYYTLRDGRKRYQKITSPTFTIAYTEGLPAWNINNSVYRRINASIYQQVKLSYFSQIDYEVEAGGFLGSTEQTHFADYKHFNTSRQYSLTDSPSNTYTLLGNYEASTNRYWVNTQINYRNQYLLLKRISFMQSLPMSETLHFKNLYTPNLGLYTEVGYSMSFINFVNLGAFSSFRKTKFDAFGVRISVNLNTILELSDDR